ncbi:hypothetical protein QE410_003220 [Microbacterium sp. SORGH_AS 1204]|uniref:hypothetical protein n=1 Tax=Microbacterium sp. SORGH_AS_1204 TaxID=3041785 RepID=UPI00278F7536|nr:hypothetical protein [Microbacterium sp. SORGH_AS_1204]MDQ1138421.1 hypothetical protein [Microbacterium sp. SORGH_AS_1204]
MGGQYSIDVAGFISTTDGVATELEVLGEAVTGAGSDLDRLADLVAVERGLGSALRSATADRSQNGPGAVQHGGAVVTAAGRVALAYVQADDDMATSTSQADAAATAPGAPGASRYGAVVR